MTLAGLSLAIGPLVDSAIICLENTHRHLGLGAKPKEAAFFGASEVAMPELVASCCTLLVLAPLAFMPGLGAFLFRPDGPGRRLRHDRRLPAVAVARPGAVRPVAARARRKPPEPHLGMDYEHRSEHERPPLWIPQPGVRPLGGAYQPGIGGYVRLLEWVMAAACWSSSGPPSCFWWRSSSGSARQLRREFFPEVDAGAFEMYVRAKSGTRIEETEKRVAEVEKFVRDKIGDDLELIISEIGVVADWSAAYTPNSGPMDAVLKVQLKHDRHHSAQEYVAVRSARRFANSRRVFGDLEFAFDAGGMIRGAMNEGKSTPINVRITGKNLDKAHQVAPAIQPEVRKVNGVVDCRIMQRLDYPEYVIEVDQAKAADLGLTQMDVMKNLVAALNSSIQFNKKNFWIDPVSHNQYYVGVQYPEEEIESIDTILDVPITSPTQKKSIPLRNMATVRRRRGAGRGHAHEPCSRPST